MSLFRRFPNISLTFSPAGNYKRPAQLVFPVFPEKPLPKLLARIRDIRASERRVWLKITDIFQECSFDYDKDSTMAKNFYAAVQNKMHYAVTGHTAAEIVQGRSDPSKPNMGLTS